MRGAITLTLMAAVILLGLGADRNRLTAANLGSPDDPVTFFIWIIWLASTLAPVLPLVAVMLDHRVRLRGAPVAVIVGPVVILGLAATVVWSVFAPPASIWHVLVLGLALTLSMTGAALLLSARRVAAGVFVLPVIVALWCLIHQIALIHQARQLASGHQSCIAAHSGPEVTSLTALRGLSLYTHRSGFKDSSHWYFHAVMIVNHRDGQQLYNWSPRDLRFHPVSARTDRDLIVPVSGSCVPRPGFLSSLPLW